jgi:UDP-N-acetylmuramyl pentapeptide phosphotransferase/UDP-N-acetylglucosamine-1-phosphate transferase
MVGRVLNAAGASLVSRQVYRRLSTGASAQRWVRTNHRGEAVSLAQGPAVALGSVAAMVTAPALAPSMRAASALAVGAAAALGMIDDLTGVTDVKGLRGHLGALRRGEVTTGTVKLVGLGATGLAAGALARRGRGGWVDAVLAGAVVAGSANLANLFDLRPGRATKVFLAASAAPILGGGSAGAALTGPASAGAVLLPEDLGERSMLGDTGANALGAAWGVGVCASLSRPALLGTVAVLVGLTVASERVSFSQVIERTPVLRELDGLGRSPRPPVDD